MSLLNRRRILMSAVDESILPSGYRKVEYLENTGTQCIDTGVRPSNNISVDITYRSYALLGISQYILGSRYSKTSEIHYAINGGSSSSDWDIRFSSGVVKYNGMPRTSNLINSKITLKDGTGDWTTTDLENVDSVTIALNKIKVSSEANLFMFSYNIYNIHPNLRIYGCKIYNSDKLIRDFIPCYRKADNVSGMYDVVNKKFYTNAGTGNFIVGGNV